MRQKMVNLPIEFRSEIEASGVFDEAWKIRSAEQSSACSIPVEFGGHGGGFSPEDLFLHALINCFVGTFKVYAKGSRLQFSRIVVKGTLTVDQDDSRAVVMKRAFIEIDLFGVDRPDRVSLLINKVLREGFILNSVKTEIQHTLNLHE